MLKFIRHESKISKRYQSRDREDSSGMTKPVLRESREIMR